MLHAVLPGGLGGVTFSAFRLTHLPLTWLVLLGLLLCEMPGFCGVGGKACYWWHAWAAALRRQATALLRLATG